MSMHTLECSGMRLLGQHDLGGHGNCGEGTALLCRGGKRYLYLAHEDGPENFSVLDVTDPTEPRLLAQTTLPHHNVRSNSLGGVHRRAVRVPEHGNARLAPHQCPGRPVSRDR
jgi:hypothetical protein